MSCDGSSSAHHALHLGIDVGGTTVKWMLVDSAGAVVGEGREETCRSGVVGQVADLASRLVAEHEEVVGIGVICPGLVDERHGRVVYAANLDLDGARVADEVGAATARPTLLGHDGRAAGLAEGLLGAGRGADSFVMMPIGTGISAALVQPSGVWGGASFSAGEIGHSPVFPDGETCLCGKRGCVEAYASAQAIGRRYARLAGEDVGAREVEVRLGKDPVADRVWADAVEALALALTHLVLAVDPGRIIIGGGLSKAGETLLGPLGERLEELLDWRPAPEIVTAELGAAAGRWGAAILASMAAGGGAHEGWSR